MLGAKHIGRRRGFTIAELLIVMGIIAILISFFMPAIAGARAKAELTAYQNVMRQNIAGLQLYCDGNAGVFPMFNTQSAVDSCILWFIPLHQEQIIKDVTDVDPITIARGDGHTIRMTLGAVYDARKLVPEIERDDKPTYVRDAQFSYPSLKGLINRVATTSGGDGNTWVTLTRPWAAPVAMGDGSVITGTWLDFVPGDYVYNIEDYYGVPVHSTWLGYLSRDR
jgi:prepilin-type N-terminal cleavage/methylation domain-containing protein